MSSRLHADVGEGTSRRVSAVPQASDEGFGRSGSYSRELEAARGIAILLVVLLHYTPFYFRPEQIERVFGFLSFVPRTGRTGVVLFFVLSAFLLTRPFWLERSGGAAQPLAGFFWRRVLRIVPMYSATVLVAYLAVGNGWAALRSLVFVTDGESLRPFSGVWWSLETEAQFYGTLGLIVFAMRGPRWRPYCVAGLVGWAAAYLVFVSGALRPFGWDTSVVPGPTLRSFAFQWPAFALGAAASWLYAERGPAWRDAVARSRGCGEAGDALMAVVLLALGAALASIELTPYIALLRAHGAWPVLEGGLWAAFLLALLVLPLYSRPLFVNRPLELLGRISYSLYLVHFPLHHYTGLLRYQARVALVGAGERTLPVAAVEMACTLGLAIGLSWITYRWVETPFLAFKDRVGGARG